MRPSRSGLLAGAVVAAVAVSGCGSGSVKKLPGSPRHIVRQAAAALARTSGLHVKGTATDKSGENSFSGDTRADGSLDIRFTTPKGSAELRSAGGNGYIKADSAYWTANASAAVAAKAANRWISVPLSSLGSDLSEFTPKSLAYCLARAKGTLGSEGTAKVGGRDATIISAAGNAAGSPPGKLYIASTGPAFPLREVQTGSRKSGGKLNPRCDSADDTTKTSDYTLSDFGASKPIAAPPGAVSVKTLG